MFDKSFQLFTRAALSQILRDLHLNAAEHEIDVRVAQGPDGEVVTLSVVFTGEDEPPMARSVEVRVVGGQWPRIAEIVRAAWSRFSRAGDRAERRIEKQAARDARKAERREARRANRT